MAQCYSSIFKKAINTLNKRILTQTVRGISDKAFAISSLTFLFLCLGWNSRWEKAWPKWSQSKNSKIWLKKSCLLSSPLASARHEQVAYYWAEAGMSLRFLWRPVVLPGLEPPFPVMPKGKDHGREKVRALGPGARLPKRPVTEPVQGWKGSRNPFPSSRRSSWQHCHCSWTSSRLKPDANGFPGSRPQHEAIESPEL